MKHDFFWLLSREPLDPYNSSDEALKYKKLKEIAQNVMAVDFPNRNIFEDLTLTKHGKQNGCNYPLTFSEKAN